jgi:TonB family protein
MGAIKPLALRPAFLASVLGLAALTAAAAVLAQAELSWFHKPSPAPDKTPTTVSISAAALEKPAPALVAETLVAPPPEIVLPRQPHILHGPVSEALPARPDARRKSASLHRHSNVQLSLSVPLISGGKPDYPDLYQNGQSGSVTVVCGLQPNGATQVCRTIRRSGDPLFDVAVHSWLDLRDVRFKPAVLHGRVTDSVTFTVIFIGEAAPA